MFISKSFMYLVDIINFENYLNYTSTLNCWVTFRNVVEVHVSFLHQTLIYWLPAVTPEAPLGVVVTPSGGGASAWGWAGNSGSNTGEISKP